MPLPQSIAVIALSAGLVGFVHSLSPSHWLPVVLLSKSRKWPLKTALLASLIASSGHIFISLLLGMIGIGAGAHFLISYEEPIEHYSGLGLILFGLLYAGYAFQSHRRCIGHTHHGPEQRSDKGPFLFLLSLGFSPCIAVFPLFVAAAPHGIWCLALSMLLFSTGVALALMGATLITTLGLFKLDHPLFEHYGDCLTGIFVALLGLILFLTPS